MSYTLLKGEFVIRYPDLPRQGPEPDGDTIKFRPDTPALVETLPRRSGSPPDINPRGISVRLEAVDALETHFEETHQQLENANAARDRLLARLGFTGVTYFRDAPNKVESCDQDSIRGHVLSNGIDANGRLIAFVHPGDNAALDGSSVFVDTALAEQSVNAELLSSGLAFPAFYATLPADLRTRLAELSTAARTAQPPAGLWPASTADPDGAATVPGLDALRTLVMWPKLFRRLVPYLAAGNADLDGFDAWLRADPVHRDDRLFRLDVLETANLHDVVHATGRTVRLTVWPETLVIDPDPATPGAPTTGTPAAAGDVVVVAVLPDPVGADAGREVVTLLNATATPVDLTGWRLLDAAGGRTDLSGALPPGGVTQVTAAATMSLGNRGDQIVLLDAAGNLIDKVDYRANQVAPGRTICIGR
ncbi:lamin tail domain-containing protein [Actinoplanes solisilvae]|uniref:lamin tail domain-containing protein n=1 Tax=Actinoplanes solisilvae TaxID=2486853 RepID=UPI000FD70145|nr:lamin tail domain-containing protein [Actinoplanes solisilvae]